MEAGEALGHAHASQSVLGISIALRLLPPGCWIAQYQFVSASESSSSRAKTFYLNGTRIYLQTEPLNNALIGAAWASYEGAKETFERFKSLGFNFLYMGNYNCEPGVHLGFTEILRAPQMISACWISLHPTALLQL